MEIIMKAAIFSITVFLGLLNVSIAKEEVKLPSIVSVLQSENMIAIKNANNLLNLNLLFYASVTKPTIAQATDACKKNNLKLTTRPSAFIQAWKYSAGRCTGILSAVATTFSNSKKYRSAPLTEKDTVIKNTCSASVSGNVYEFICN
jgi:hypothetical protein